MNDHPFQLRTAEWPDDTRLLRLVREEVFVREQKVPLELEWDEWDERSEHVLALNDAGDPIGTGRLLPDGHIGRMAVRKHYRGLGVGTAMLELLLIMAQEKRLPRAILNAQVSAIPFYERFGFNCHGPQFMEAGIPHREMIKRL